MHDASAERPQPSDELRTEDVDAAVEHAPPEGDLVLLLLELADHDAQVVVGQSREIGQWFHRRPFLVGHLSKAGEILRGQPQLETFAWTSVRGRSRSPC